MPSTWLFGFLYSQWIFVSQPGWFHFLILFFISLLHSKQHRALWIFGLAWGTCYSFQWASPHRCQSITSAYGITVIKSAQGHQVAFGATQPRKPISIFKSNSLFPAPRCSQAQTTKTSHKNRYQQWVQALLLGQTEGLDPKLKSSFIKSGLVHLLCISGFHIQLLYNFLYQCLTGLAQLLYKTRQTEASFFFIRHQSHLALAPLLFYSASLGFPPSVQRATLLCISKLYSSTQQQNIFFAVSFQTLLFPYSFLAPSNFLSWSAYLFVQGHTGHLTKNIGLCTMSLLVIDSFPLHAPLVNFVFLPMFPIIYGVTLCYSVVPLSFLEKILDTFFLMVKTASLPAEEWKWMTLSLSPQPSYIQYFVVMTFFITLWAACQPCKKGGLQE